MVAVVEDVLNEENSFLLLSGIVIPGIIAVEALMTRTSHLTPAKT